MATTVYFQEGTTTTYGHTSPAQSRTGNTYQNVSANISTVDLRQQIISVSLATNNGGTTYGSDGTFTTQPY